MFLEIAIFATFPPSVCPGTGTVAECITARTCPYHFQLAIPVPVFCKLPAKYTHFLPFCATLFLPIVPCSPIKRLSPRRQPIKTRILFLKRPDHFERAVFREDLFVFRVLANVTFGTPSPTRLLKITMHGLTDHSCQQREKREDIGPVQIEPKLFADFK